MVDALPFAMGNRLVILLAVLAIIASACGSTAKTVDVAAPAELDDTATSADVDGGDLVAETTTTTPESTLLPSGRERILANEADGKPYVLWFWGAH